MICIICDEAETLPGQTSILLEREEHSFTFNNVPAHICPKCGEAYVDEAVTGSLLHEAERMAASLIFFYCCVHFCGLTTKTRSLKGTKYSLSLQVLVPLWLIKPTLLDTPK